MMRALWGYGLSTICLELVEVSWEGTSERVKIPYTKTKNSHQDPEYCETRETLQEVGGTTLQG